MPIHAKPKYEYVSQPTAVKLNSTYSVYNMPPKSRKRIQKGTGKGNLKRPRKLEHESGKCEIPSPPGFSLFQELFDRGLDHVVRDIFSHLDHKSIANCMLLCRDFERTLRNGVLKTEKYRQGEISRSCLSAKRPPMVDLARMSNLTTPPKYFNNDGWYVVHCDGQDLYYFDRNNLYKFVDFKLVNSARIIMALSFEPQLACGPGVLAIMSKGDRYQSLGPFFTSLTLVSRDRLEMLRTVEMRFHYCFQLEHSILLIQAPHEGYEEITLHNVLQDGQISLSRKKLRCHKPSFEEFSHATSGKKFAANNKHIFAATWCKEKNEAILSFFEASGEMNEMWNAKAVGKYDVWVELTNTYACAFLQEKVENHNYYSY